MQNFSDNVLVKALGIQVPIAQGPMGGVAGSELVAAVANAGGLGMLPIWHQPQAIGLREIRKTQSLTGSPFAVNLRADLVQIALIEAALEQGVAIIHLFWGDPEASMKPIREAGASMIATVGDCEAAKKAMDAGAIALIAQGIEAGGHVLGETPLANLLNEILPIAGSVPVIAAGGITTSEDIRQVLDAGASGTLLGTRFVATEESLAHPDYKIALINAGADSTARSKCFDIGWPEAPHRHLINATYTRWKNQGRPLSGKRPGENDTVLVSGDIDLPRYSVAPPAKQMTGDILEACLYAGTGVNKIDDIPAVNDLILELTSLL